VGQNNLPPSCTSQETAFQCSSALRYWTPPVSSPYQTATPLLAPPVYLVFLLFTSALAAWLLLLPSEPHHTLAHGRLSSSSSPPLSHPQLPPFLSFALDLRLYAWTIHLGSWLCLRGWFAMIYALLHSLFSVVISGPGEMIINIYIPYRSDSLPPIPFCMHHTDSECLLRGCDIRRGPGRESKEPAIVAPHQITRKLRLLTVGTWMMTVKPTTCF
jgi:hypothetical protein